MARKQCQVCGQPATVRGSEAKRIAALPAGKRAGATPQLRDTVGWSAMLESLEGSDVGEEHRRNVAAVTGGKR